MNTQIDYYTEAVKAYADRKNPYVVERMVLNLLSAESTEHGCAYDGILKSGKKIEIKFSNPVKDKEKNGASPSYFLWQKLLGNNGHKKNKVDFLILCGHYKRFYFWVIPYEFVIKTTAEFQISDRKYNMKNWIKKYFVGDEGDLVSFFEAQNA